MAKVDRGVAQRYAAKRRKKRPSGPRTFTPAPPAQFETESQVGATPDDAARAPEHQVTPPRRAAGRPLPSVRITNNGTARVTRPAARPFSAYVQEYGYVAGDLRRVVLISGGLLAVLVVLSFFVQ